MSARAALLLARHAFDSFRNVRRARALTTAALEKDPALEAAILLRGRIEASLGFPRAEERAIAALPPSPATLAARLRKARFLSEGGRPVEAAALLGETLAANPWSGETRLALVAARLTGDRVEEAEASLREAAELTP